MSTFLSIILLICIFALIIEQVQEYVSEKSICGIVCVFNCIIGGLE
jgi:hypothetical protein